MVTTSNSEENSHSYSKGAAVNWCVALAMGITPGLVQREQAKTTISWKGVHLLTLKFAACGSGFYSNLTHILRLPASSLETRETWMNLEVIMPSEINQAEGRQKNCMVSITSVESKKEKKSNS